MNNSNPTIAAAVLTTDPQTGLPTLLRLCSELHASVRLTAPLTLVVCALDGLVAPQRGDESPVVSEIAQLLEQATENFIGAQVYRTAFDSFAIVLPGLDRGAGLVIAEQIHQAIEQIGAGIVATLAVGSAPQDARDAGALLAICEAQLLNEATAHNHVYAAAPIEALPVATARLVNLLIARLIALVELGEQLRVTEQQAFHDPVTGLPNARSLNQTLPRFIERCTRQNQPLALLLIDGDNLKEYNTRLGYSAGDEWIRSIARTITANLRPGDYVARWMMGDEFVALLPDTAPDAAQEAAERLRAAVETAGATSQYPGTVSIGVIAVASGAEAKTVLEGARIALLDAKNRGRNRVTLLAS